MAIFESGRGLYRAALCTKPVDYADVDAAVVLTLRRIRKSAESRLRDLIAPAGWAQAVAAGRHVVDILEHIIDQAMQSMPGWRRYPPPAVGVLDQPHEGAVE